MQSQRVQQLLQWVEFLEGETFTTRVGLPPEGEVTEHAVRQKQILEYCIVARSREAMMPFLGLGYREHSRGVILMLLLEQGVLIPTIPVKPNSPKQCYVTIKGLTP
ncbi:MAG: hypothetical protein CVV47_14990 [Spirochaetae bacterium HGW-Spirochaetae-3]|jgi:ATP-dependent DNA helicase RecG|nr:MAG: hypothetical protein CVV47_14990 [Spirochaetae bacterium HGW-Spirochaetae-3]